MLAGADPGHRVACHHAEAIRDGRLQPHSVDPVLVADDVLAGPPPEHPGSVTEVLGR